MLGLYLISLYHRLEETIIKKFEKKNYVKLPVWDGPVYDISHEVHVDWES